MPPLRPSPLALGGALRRLHTSPPAAATPLPIVATGPPPQPPAPPEPSDPASTARARAHRRAQHAAQLARANEPGKPSMRKRFWKHVQVQQALDGHFTVALDGRAVRTPHTKAPLRIPPTKPVLAAAVALEWDVLTSAHQATRAHYIPLTSLTARALDIGAQDQVAAGADGGGEARREIAAMLLRYLDTDTLLCWAPADGAEGEEGAEAVLGDPAQEPQTLREAQRRAAAPVVRFLEARVWPGARLRPALEGASLMPRAQAAETREAVRVWLAARRPWELAALERAALAGKSLCVAARLVAEWSRGGDGLFGVEEAADACTVEVRWQTRRWGEVEDTHDVDREDLRRQLGSAVLLVSGGGAE